MANVETPNGLRLLVVEDQRVLLQSLLRGLTAEGYAVSEPRREPKVTASPRSSRRMS